MGNNVELFCKCNGLLDNRVKLWTENNMQQLRQAFYKLVEEYGPAEVLGTLASLWDAELANEFFLKLNFNDEYTKSVKKIATYYSRAYGGGVQRVQAQLINLWIKMGYEVV